MRKSVFAGVLLTAVSLGALSCKGGIAGPEAARTAGLWIGSSQITMSRKTSDFTIGYTMRSDFWFRVDADGTVKGKAYAVYQPTFDAAGMNGKILLAKSVVNGALSLLPGGELALAKSAIDTGKAGANITVAGLVGVVGKYNDPKPIRTGEITGSLRRGKLTLSWAEKQPSGIPVTISLQYVNKLEPIAHPTLETQDPWQQPATLDPDAGGRFAVAQDQASSSKDGLTEATFAYWSAVRVE